MSHKCARCNKPEKDVSKLQEFEGELYGPECVVKVRGLAENLGLHGRELLSRARQDYKADMRRTTIAGMIRKGMFPGISSVEEFEAQKSAEASALAQKRSEREAARKAKVTAVAEPVLEVVAEVQWNKVSGKRSKK